MPEPPRQSNRIQLPEHLSGWRRAAGAVNAALRSEEAAPVGAERTASMTIQYAPSPTARMSRAWRESAYPARLDAAIRAPRLNTCATIAVVSPKGGVGKTTVSALLGTLLADLRSDRVVAVDTNPDFGSLGRALTPGHEVYVDDMLQILESNRNLTVTELDSTLGRASHGLMVLPAPADPARMARLGQESYGRVIQRLQELAGILILDCGTGLQDPAVKAALAASDQLVLVSDADPGTASLVAEAGHLLVDDGIPVLLMVNKLPAHRARLDTAAFAAAVPHATGIVTLPESSDAAALLSQGRFDWSRAPRSWQIATRELALALMAEWPALGLTQPAAMTASKNSKQK